jgi:hypothetical protein
LVSASEACPVKEVLKGERAASGMVFEEAEALLVVCVPWLFIPRSV